MCTHGTHGTPCPAQKQQGAAPHGNAPGVHDRPLFPAGSQNQWLDHAGAAEVLHGRGVRIFVIGMLASVLKGDSSLLPGLCSPSHQTPLTYARIVFVRLLSTRTTITESSIPSTATKVRVANLEEAYNKVKPAQGECICHKCKVCASAPSVTKSEGQATPLHPFGNRTPATIRPSTRPPLLDPPPRRQPRVCVCGGGLITPLHCRPRSRLHQCPAGRQPALQLPDEGSRRRPQSTGPGGRSCGQGQHSSREGSFR